jgi:hypothetical protein
VGRAQRELDRHSIQTQEEILADPELSAAGVQTTFYQIPKVELELTMAISMTPQTSAEAKSSKEGATIVKPSKIRVAPVNAYYQNQFGFSAQASSKLKLTIVPVPPPGQSA